MALFPTDFTKKIKRAVQKADQSFGRSEKSEVITDEIQSMEKMIELIKKAFQSTIRQLQGCLPPSAEPEKRLRKLPESILSTTLHESASLLTQNPAFSKTFNLFGDVEQTLADSILHYTVEVEKNVLQPLLNLVEKDIPGILKLRKQLTNMTLDMDSAKKSYATLQKQTQITPGKMDSARAEADSKEAIVDQSRDQLMTEMYQFFSREEKLCKLLLSALQLQAGYHQRSLESLNRKISQMSEEIEKNTVKPVYGCDLKEHLFHTKQEIATVIGVCTQSIVRQGLDAEGLFRIAPSTSKLRKLTAAFDANTYDDDNDWEDMDTHCFAGALKLYLRELPEPLLTFELYNDWSRASQRSDSEKFHALADVLKRLPKPNYDNFRYLMKFMAKVTEHSEENKMSPSNLTIVVAPNLLYRSKSDQGSVQMAGIAMSVVEPFISHCDWFFPDDTSSASPSPTVPRQIEEHEHNRRSPNMELAHKLLERSKPRSRKPLAPAPPIGVLGRARSESSELDGDPNMTIALPKAPEVISAVPENMKPPEKIDGPRVPQKKPRKLVTVDGAENDSTAVRLQRPGISKSLDELQDHLGVELDQLKSEDGEGAVFESGEEFNNSCSSNPEVFSPSPYTPSPVSESVADVSGLDAETGVSFTPPCPVADSPNLPVEPVTDNTAKESSSESKPQVFRKHSRGASLTERAVSTTSSLTSFLSTDRHRDVDNSVVLPSDGVSLCRITPRSDDANVESHQGSKDANIKVPPRPPPRSPLKEARTPKPDEKEKYSPVEDTHL